MPSASDAIVEHEPGDLTVVVGAGMRLRALQDALAPHGQRLSLDPPGDPTLEECVLDDLAGPLQHRFGRMRDLVIGITVTLVDGTRANSGGKVVKNVAGYDLGKLFCGSRGRLGRVEQVALKLHPRPKAARSMTPTPRGGASSSGPGSFRAPSTSQTTACTSSSRARSARWTRRCMHWAAASRSRGRSCARCSRGFRADAGGTARQRRSSVPALALRISRTPGEQAWSPLAERVVEALCSPS